jgi:transposase InsO family protein
MSENVDSEKIDEKLKLNYYSPELPGSYSGLETFYKELKKRNINYSKSDIKRWLQSQNSYSHHFPARKNFPRLRVLVHSIDQTWQIDLIDVSNIAKFNDGFNFLITCIDVFSKYAWAIPLKNKSAKSVIKSFEQILKSGRKPEKIQSDEGKEFFNKDFQRFLSAHDIKLYKTNSEMKACIVERFNRTLKEKMYRYFTHNKNFNYVTILEHVVTSYNNTHHRTIKRSPSSVNKDNEFETWKNIYGLFRDVKYKLKFKVGDHVLIAKDKKRFEKGYTRRWVREVFIVKELISQNPASYKIKDFNDEDVEGIFYEPQLQKIYKKTFEVEKIIDTKEENNKKEFLVRWSGFSNKFNTWVPESKLKT